MENGEAKEKAQEHGPEARCWIDKGTLHLEVPLFMPNGEIFGYGMLHKAAMMVGAFFRQIDRETAQDRERSRIINPLAKPGMH